MSGEVTYLEAGREAVSAAAAVIMVALSVQSDIRLSSSARWRSRITGLGRLIPVQRRKRNVGLPHIGYAIR